MLTCQWKIVVSYTIRNRVHQPHGPITIAVAKKSNAKKPNAKADKCCKLTPTAVGPLLAAAVDPSRVAAVVRTASLCGARTRLCADGSPVGAFLPPPPWRFLLFVCCFVFVCLFVCSFVRLFVCSFCFHR